MITLAIRAGITHRRDSSRHCGESAQGTGKMHIRSFAAICCICFLGSAAAQFGGFGGPAGADPIPAVKSDLPYIRCGACEALAKNAYRQIKALKDAQKPGKKVRGSQ